MIHQLVAAQWYSLRFINHHSAIIRVVHINITPVHKVPPYFKPATAQHLVDSLFPKLLLPTVLFQLHVGMVCSLENPKSDSYSEVRSNFCSLEGMSQVISVDLLVSQTG